MKILQNNYNHLRKKYQVITCPKQICQSQLEIEPADVQDDGYKINYEVKCPLCHEMISVDSTKWLTAE